MLLVLRIVIHFLVLFFILTDGSKPSLNLKKYSTSITMNVNDVTKTAAFEGNKQIGKVCTLEFSK